MSEQNVKNSDEIVDKEIVLEIKDNKNDIKTDEVKEEEEVKEKPTPKFVDKKRVAELTDDEKALIIAKAKNGIDQPNFSVKFFNNGKYRIVKKKEQTPTVSQKAITSTPPTNEATKVYYSDNQLLFERIIELNAKIDRLMQKQKKLKRKYQALQNDLYIEEEDDLKNEQTLSEQTTSNEQALNEQASNENKNIYAQPTRRGWRSQIKYI